MSSEASQARQSHPADQPQSLRAVWARAEKLRQALESGAIPFAGGGSSTPYGEAVTTAVAAYEDCAGRIARLALFSSNEAAEDIATPHLPYLLVPFRLADVVQRLPSSLSSSSSSSSSLSPAEARRQLLRRAREAYERFLHAADGYGLLSAAQAKLLQAYTEDPAHFSPAGFLDGTPTMTTTTSRRGGVASLVDPAARRNAKIANFQAEKALRGRLEVLQKRQDERRERRRRQRRRIREAEADMAEAEEDMDDAEDDDEDEGEDEDDEAARELYMAQLAFCTHMAFQSLESLRREDELLAMAPRPPAGGPQGPRADTRMGGLGDHQQRQAGGSGYTERLEQISPFQRLQSSAAFVGSSPTWAGPGPLLTADGKPRQPFTIMGSRAEMTKAVFRPGHNLPTMSIDEYLEEERRRGGIIEGGGPSSGLPAEPDEDNMEKADEETLKARAWDEFTEANPKGAGNTLNRG